MAESDGDIPPRMKAAGMPAGVTALWWFESTSFYKRRGTCSEQSRQVG